MGLARAEKLKARRESDELLHKRSFDMVGGGYLPQLQEPYGGA
jgi:hypothetical protein